MGLRTEFDFVLPKGYVDDVGVLHREGTMRLATARDEIEPLRDRAISDADDPYLTVLVLQRVVIRLGTLTEVTLDVVEGLFAADLAFLQDLYGIINFGDPNDVEALQASVLPESDLIVDDVAEPVEPDPSPSADADAGPPDEADDPATAATKAAVKQAARRRGQIEEVPASSRSR